MMDTPFTEWHDLRNELPFPGAPDVVGEGGAVAVVVAEHQGPEVGGGPDAHEGEVGVWVVGGVFACRV